MQHQLGERGGAEEAARGDGHGDGDDAPGESLEGLEVLAQAQAAVGGIRGRRGEEVDVLGLLDDPHPPPGKLGIETMTAVSETQKTTGSLLKPGSIWITTPKKAIATMTRMPTAWREVTVVAEGVGDDGVEAGDEQDEDVVLELFQDGRQWRS